MSHQQHHYGDRSYGRGDYGRGHGRGGRGDDWNRGEGWQRGGGRSYNRDQRGGNSGGRGGGRISGGRFWSDQRRMIENEGITVKTNCFQLAPVQNNDDNTSAVIHQYAVRIDSLGKTRDTPLKDSSCAPSAVATLPDSAAATTTTTTVIMKPFVLVRRKEITNPEDERSTIESRRVLNHCQRKLQEVTPHQMFVSYLFVILPCFAV
jgi:hypothetical protein